MCQLLLSSIRAMAFVLCHSQVSAYIPSSTGRASTTRRWIVASPRATSTNTRILLISSMKKSDNTSYETFFDSLGPLRFTVPALFVGQILFLTAANLVCGLDNLTIYGELGNAYIRNNGGYDTSKPFLQRQGITSAGQKVWLNNVLRDLSNGGPVQPPLTEP